MAIGWNNIIGVFKKPGDSCDGEDREHPDLWTGSAKILDQPYLYLPDGDLTIEETAAKHYELNKRSVITRDGN